MHISTDPDRSISIVCGSEPARDSGGSDRNDVECTAAIASRARSHRVLGDRKFSVQPNPCGSEPCSRLR
ncbi:hypothetical protein FGE05_04640 [Pseudomonas sp. ICMP22404]|nr:hypothetical protein FGE05_04640 [Pseudomonas sp. ICMP22404]